METRSCLDGARDERLVFPVERAGRFIEDQQLGPAKQRPCQGDALALASGQPGTAVAEDRLQAIRQLIHKSPERSPSRAPPTSSPRRRPRQRGGSSRRWCRGAERRPGARRPPDRATPAGCRHRVVTPSMVTAPRLGSISPISTSAMVLLPLPDGPTRAVICRAGKVKDTSASSSSVPAPGIADRHSLEAHLAQERRRGRRSAPARRSCSRSQLARMLCMAWKDGRLTSSSWMWH